MTLSPAKSVVKIAACALFLLSLCWSDSLTLRDGRHLEGKYLGGSSAVVAFASNGAVQYFPVTDVLAVVFGDAGVDSPFGGIQQNSLRHRREPKHRNFQVASGSFFPRLHTRAELSTTKSSQRSTLFGSAVPTGDHMYRILAASLSTGSQKSLAWPVP